MLVSKVLVKGEGALFTTDKVVDSIEFNKLSVLSSAEDDAKPERLVKYNEKYVNSLGTLLYKNNNIKECILDGFNDLVFVDPENLSELLVK